MRPSAKASIWLGAPVVLLLAAYGLSHEYVRAASFVVRAAGMQGIARSAAEWEAIPMSVEAATVPTRAGDLASRLYVPETPRRIPILLVPGVHASGIEEPRLVGFARDLAAAGHIVLTVPLADLERYAITVRVTDTLEDAAGWLAGQPRLAPDGRVGMMGISFAGGLSIVAAGRPSIRDRVAFVMSFGGHGDLPRTLRYLCTGLEPDGSTRPPHDYGVAIILLGVARLVVPAEHAEPLRGAILTFLEASRLDMVDKAKSQAEFVRARELETALPEPSRTLMGYVNARDVAHLGPILLPHVSALGGDPALSPSRSDPPAGDVYLLHGADDNVIPAAESILLARELRDRGARVRQLATPLITHAEVDRAADAGDVWNLVRFWRLVLGES